jgi:sugar phosphate isomerase/epimerase
MNLSCLPVSIYPELINGAIAITDWAKFANEIGLDSIDLSVLITRNIKKRELNKLDLPLGIDSIAAYTDFTNPDIKIRENEFDQFKQDIEDAEQLGAKYMRITSGQNYPEIDRETGIALTVKYFVRAAEFAEKSKVKLLFENHSKPGIWQYYDFAGAPDVYFEIVNSITGNNIDLLFDTANALVYTQDPIEMMNKIYSRIKRIHLNDIRRIGILDPVGIGKGVVEFNAIFKYLKDHNYQGALSIEEASFSGLEGIKKAVVAVSNLLNNT